jgi:hypothetical protein
LSQGRLPFLERDAMGRLQRPERLYFCFDDEVYFTGAPACHPTPLPTPVRISRVFWTN